MRIAALLLAFLALAGCSQPKPRQVAPVAVSPSPVCRSESACSAAWARASDQIQRITGMQLSVASDDFLQTYPMYRFPFMSGMVNRIDNGDGTQTIKASFTCRSSCEGLDASAENLFNSVVGIGL